MEQEKLSLYQKKYKKNYIDRQGEEVVVHPIVHVLQHTSPLLIYLLVAIILLLESSGVPITNNTLLLLMGAMEAHGYINL